jgi:ribosomal protein S18 acetylase RimI-like enzyme
MSFTLQDATLDDAALVTSLIHQGFEQYRNTLYPPSGAHNETVDTIGDKMKKGGAILARCDDEWAGCVLYYPDAEKGLMYLGRLAILPQFRRRGIARALSLAVEDKTREAGLPGLWLGVRVALEGNQQLFESLGYTVASSEKHPGVDYVTFYTMQKILPP